MPYFEVKTRVPETWHSKLQKLLTEDRRVVPIRINLESEEKEHTLLLTKGQMIKMESAKQLGKKYILLRFSRRQIRANTAHEGGFLSTLIGLASKILPTLLGGLATGVIGGLAEKAISGRGTESGSGLFIAKRGRGTSEIHIVEGGGLYLSPPQRNDDNYEGMYVVHNGEVFRGAGLILGKNSPFQNIPILGWLL